MTQRNFDFLAVVGIFVAYTATIRVAMGEDLIGCLLGGVANTIPVVIFGMVVRHIIVRRLLGKPLEIQLAAHLGLCAAFCVLSYCLLIVLLGLFNGAGPDGFVVRPFAAGGTAWQSLENVTTYALIAAVSHLQALNNVPQASRQAASAARADVETRELAAADVGSESHSGEVGARTSPPVDAPLPAIGETEADAGAGAGISRYFVKIGDELRPLDIDTVVSINGAGDYAEVRTVSGKHLVRVTLADFAKSLDPSKYVRVHRSWIVNTHRVARAEPAGGGRLILHMETGQTISTSRDGAKLLRNRVL
jgi:DNA-binding LytR/AlgR family response regulator